MTDNDNLLSVEKDLIQDDINQQKIGNEELDTISEPIPISDEIKDIMSSIEPEILSETISIDDVVDAIIENDINETEYNNEIDSDSDADVLFVKTKKTEDEMTISIQSNFSDELYSENDIPTDEIKNESNTDDDDEKENITNGNVESIESDRTSSVCERRCLTAPNYIADDLQKGVSEIADAVVMFASGVNKKCCRILVSSPVRSTGKTTIALMLALELSKEYKVLLADCDFYKPRLHKYFNCMNRFGILNAYLGEVYLKNVILNTDNDNLKFITSGKGLKLKDIKGKAITSMLDSVSEDFDFVIFDSASVFKARYVSGIAASVDASLLVVKKRSTEYADLDKSLDRLDMVGSEILGVVFNS